MEMRKKKQPAEKAPAKCEGPAEKPPKRDFTKAAVIVMEFLKHFEGQAPACPDIVSYMASLLEAGAPVEDTLLALWTLRAALVSLDEHNAAQTLLMTITGGTTCEKIKVVVEKPKEIPTGDEMMYG